MNVRNQIIVIIVLVIASLVVGLGFATHTLILQDFADLEDKHLEDTMDRTIRSIEREQQFLSISVMDWSDWDDTYLFVQGMDPEYVQKNLDDSVFHYFNLNAMIFTGPDGDVVYARGFDPGVGEDKEIPPQLYTLHDSLLKSDAKELSGIYETKGGLMLVAVRPIRMSWGEGPVMGTLLFARVMDERWVLDLSDLAGVPIRITDIPEAPLPAVEPSLAISKDGDTITGSTVIYDLFGEPVMMLSITQERTIYRKGLLAYESGMVAILIFSGITAILFYLLVNHIFLRRITRLNREVQDITGSTSTTASVGIDGDDEVAELAASINGMLDSLEKDQQVIRESEEKYRLIAENTADIIYICDMNLNLTYVSPSVTKVKGFTIEEALAMPIEERNTPASIKEIMALFTLEMENEATGSADSDRTITFESEEYCKNGSIILVENSVRFLRDTEGKPVAILGIGHDYTERKRAEDALQLTNAKLQLLSSITRHDILNKVMIAKGYLELAEEAQGEDVQADYLKEAQKATEAIQKQIEFTREYQQLGIQSPAWQTISSLIESIDDSELPLTSVCTGIQIYADPMIERAFFNLYENTLRHAKGATRVLVSCEETDSGLLITWEDDGCGIPDNEKEHIFQRGFGKNTGFGLFLVREILDITRISITEDGLPGKGARFRMLVREGGYRMA
ncbi:PAS domain S-box protein [Methanocalculus taiwanensis]|uniref:histidine kinase n=1 Tax=Methanocalculus taiwanensis TaxID=106207 RepID=A0ABD4THB9_9EURY|nr:CHASE4 domain-containing protein [Methanocalculus taiwanensis]MCQ1538116.1 PAS domain S-box protein [Methanocalculus taiwanensis]